MPHKEASASYYVQSPWWTPTDLFDDRHNMNGDIVSAFIKNLMSLPFIFFIMIKSWVRDIRMIIYTWHDNFEEDRFSEIPSQIL